MAAPTVSAISPTSCYYRKESVVTVTGANFFKTGVNDVSSISIGGSKLYKNEYTVASDTTITLNAPLYLPVGANHILVTTSGGTNVAGVTDTLTVLARPTFVLDPENRFGDFIDINGNATQVQLDASGNLPTNTNVTASISASDIEIGAVELKNGSSDLRAVITAAGLEVDMTDDATRLLGKVDCNKSLVGIDASANAISGTVAISALPAPYRAATYAQVLDASGSAWTNHELIADPGVGKTIVIDSVIFSNGATAGTFQLVSDTGGTPTALTNLIYLGVNSGAVIKADPIIGVVHKNVGITQTGVTTNSTMIMYHIEG